ncbi:hypothetical protein [Burkholderia ubonensis]|nr:hypothetical protein [Burkholderia ubonensis]
MMAEQDPFDDQASYVPQHPNKQWWALCSFAVRFSNRFEIKPVPSHLKQ